MIWFAVPALSVFGMLFLYFDFRRQSKRTPAVDAVFGGFAIFIAMALWCWMPSVFFG